MSNITPAPFFRITSVWISGIIVAICHPISLSSVLIFLLVYTLFYMGLFTFLKKKFKQTAFWWFHLIGLTLIFLVSYVNALLYLTQKQQGNIIEWLSANKQLEGYQVKIKKVYNTSYHGFICSAFVTHIKNHSGWHTSTGVIQLYFCKKSDYKPEDSHILLICGTPTQQLPAHSPQQKCHVISLYDQPIYRHLLKQKNKDFIVLAPLKYNEGNGWPIMIRQWYGTILQKQVKDKQTIALVETLLLGKKDHFDSCLRKAYADTGTIHVLAISGLHVGMLYLVLGTVFRFILSRIRLHFLSDIFTLFLLWLYAWLCHFAPPILRATTMITISRVGFLMHKTSNQYNELFASAFALLLWQPCLLLNCGFQLSYMATLGILYLQPHINNVILVQNYWLQKIWKATSMSIAAQVSTLPLILYYFKQFPLYFIIANWIVVPAIFVILILSLALAAGSYIPMINMLLSFSLTKLIWLINRFVCWVAQWPCSTLHNRSVNECYLCLLYIILISIYLFFKHKNLIYIVVITLCTAFYAVKHIQLIIAVANSYSLICTNNPPLSFILKDGRQTLHCTEIASNSTLSCMRPYAGGIMAVLCGKIIFTIKTIPYDWYSWNSPKLHADYLFIEQKLLKDLAVFVKVFKFSTLVIYGNRPKPLYYGLRSTITKLGIQYIWLKPGAQKMISWPKNI